MTEIVSTEIPETLPIGALRMAHFSDSIAALLTRARKDLVEDRPFGHYFGPVAVMPSPHRAVTDGDLVRHLEAAGLDVDQQFAPILRAFARLKEWCRVATR